MCIYYLETRQHGLLNPRGESHKHTADALKAFCKSSRAVLQSSVKWERKLHAYNVIEDKKITGLLVDEKVQATCIKGREKYSVHSHRDNSIQVTSDLTNEKETAHISVAGGGVGQRQIIPCW